jgi:hypothetical protein
LQAVCSIKTVPSALTVDVVQSHFRTECPNN